MEMLVLALKEQLITIRSKGDKFFYLFPFLFITLCILRDFQVVPIDKFILVGVCAVAFIVLNYSEVLYFLCFLVPLKSGIPGNYIFILALLALLVKSPQIKKQQIIIGLAFILYETLLDVVSPYSIEKIEFISYISRLFLVFFLLYQDISEIDVKKACFWYGVGAFVLGLIITANSIRFLGAATTFGGYRIGRVKYFLPDNHSLLFDINADGLGNFGAIGLSCFITVYYQNYLEGKGLWSKNQLLCLVLGVLTVACASLSVSRTLIVVVFFNFVFVLIGLYRVGGKKRFLQLLVALFFLGLLFLLTPVGQSYFERFTNIQSLVTGSGRTHIFREYFLYQTSHLKILLFGLGVRAYASMNHIFMNAIHNMFQQIIFCYGLLGGLPLLYFLIKPTYRTLKEQWYHNIHLLLPLLSVFLCAQTTQVLAPNDILMSLPVAIWASRYIKDTI